MNKHTIEELRYPIGHFAVPDRITDAIIHDWIAQLEAFPEALKDMVKNLNEEQLETPYRLQGWTVRQLIHHIADSHHNSYIRFKWALTEETPVIKPYDEKAWAALFDTCNAPIALSLNHLKAVHAKLVYLLKGLSEKDLSRTFIHPDSGEATSLAENIGRYAWHGRHHYTHIKNLMQREGWNVNGQGSAFMEGQ